MLSKFKEFFQSIKDIRIKDLEETNQRLQNELEYRDRFEEELIQRIEYLESCR